MSNSIFEQRVFKEVLKDIGSINHGSRVFIEFEFKEGFEPSEIDINEEGKLAIKTGCSCVASFRIERNKLIVEYKDSTIKSKNPIDQQTDEKEFKKTFRVFFKGDDPSIPLKIKNDRGAIVYNLKRPNLLLTFHGVYSD